MTRILLVGTGFTSAIAGAILKQELPKVELTMWDKARGAGGRMTTFRNPNDSSATLDLGAQYISATPDYAKVHSSYYAELQKAGVLTPLTVKIGGIKGVAEGTEQYVAPAGISSLVKHYLKKATSEIKFDHHVQKIMSEGKGWKVVAGTGQEEYFDIVILTMPVPQILRLSGEVKKLIESNTTLHDQLKSVEYSSRFALGLFYKADSEVSLSDGNCAQYITNHPVIRYVSIDNKKRGKDDACPSVIAHTSVPFGKANLGKSAADLEGPLLSIMKKMFPHWPEPQFVKCQKWLYSQVSSAFPGLPGAVEISAGLILGGDAFTHSNMDGCIESAKAVADVTVRRAAML